MKKFYGINCLLIAAALISNTAQARFIEHKEHHLGPAGLYGVTSPKDIKITKVVEGSPADGKIKAGDVIVQAGGTTFKDQTRKQLAEAIDRAESKQGRGVLTLALQDGRKVDLQLKVLGSYSATAPFDCPKTDAIITETSEYLVKTKKFGRGGFYIGLLGLLATGEQKYIDVVKQTIHQAEWASPKISLSLETYGRTAWNWGYTNILLCEYYLLTGDDYVLPAIKAYSVAIASGRDAAGLWGHGMATYDLNRGQPHGRLPGYAVMNQSSLPCFISLLLADKCGVKHPEIQAGILQTHGFYTDFIGRGTLPYGVHNPNAKSYNNNGMSGLAAVAFSLHGNKEGAAFFSQMSAAAHNIMETGHTGHYFNQLWTGLGANVAGPETTIAFFKETRWLHTLNRTWEGNFTYDGCGYPNGTFSYRGLSDAGSHLLNYCLARRKLYITGRNADRSLWLKGQEVADTVALATLDVKDKSDKELLTLFGHPMPKVRVEAIWTLRPREHKLTDAIHKMIREGTNLERESAIGYFGYGCPKEVALPVKEDLASILRDPDEDLELRAAAADALCWLGEDAYAYFEDMLKIIVINKPKDPRGRIDETVGRSLNVLCPNPYAAGLVKDKQLFYSAAHKLLNHRRASGRTTGAKLIANMPLDDFYRVAETVRHIIDDQDITYHSYHNLGPKTEAISILANLNIEGGIEAALETLEAKTGKFGFKIRMLMAVLPKYGANAKPVLPKLKAMNIQGRFEKPWNAMIQSIESAEGNPKMISFEDAKEPR
jgi:hypothetical protein